MSLTPEDVYNAIAELRDRPFEPSVYVVSKRLFRPIAEASGVPEDQIERFAESIGVIEVDTDQPYARGTQD